jgi:hypothetical protein
MNLPPGSVGYGAQHLQYAAQRARWANAAQRRPTAETILLEITAIHETTGKKRNACNNIIGVHRSFVSNISMTITYCSEYLRRL